jgi:penicillin amidase
VPLLVKILRNDGDGRIQRAVKILADWDFCMEPDSVAASLFNVFFVQWCRQVTAERFPESQVELVSANAGGLASKLLADDSFGWFRKATRDQAARSAFLAGLDELTRRLGDDMKAWTWGRLHILLQKHFLSDRGDLGKLLDRSGPPTRGDGTTVCSSTCDANHSAWLGASYRMVADMIDPDGFRASHVSGNSGHPGSPHYDDQLEPWNRGELRYLSLAAPEVEGQAVRLLPG